MLQKVLTPATLPDVLTAFLLALLFWLLPTPVDIAALIQKKAEIPYVIIRWRIGVVR